MPEYPRVTRVYQARMHNLAIALQALVAASIFFVWVVRYANIVDEFNQYGCLPGRGTSLAS